MASTQVPPVGLSASRTASHAAHANPMRRPEAITYIPPMPRWGNERHRLLMRFGYCALAGAILAAVLVVAVDNRWVTGGVLSAVAPGMGFIYDGWPILFVLTWVLFWLAWNLWIGFGSLIHLVGVYLASIAGSAALADGPRLGSSSGTVWEWAVPVGFIGAGLYGSYHVARMMRSRSKELAARDERNAYLASVDAAVVEQLVRSFDPPTQRASVQAFDPIAVQRDATGKLQPPLPVTDVDAGLINWLLRISMQPLESFEGWDWGPNAVEPSALRYQVNSVGYGLAYFQANYAPAYPGLLGQAQRNVIDKAQEIPVWGYWYGESLMGNIFGFRADPIEADGQNVMFSGFLARHIGHYEAATHDHRYDEPGALTFTWDDGRSWSYSYPEIAAYCARSFAESPMALWPCEPNQVYTVCNQMGASGLQAFGSIHGTDDWERVSDHYQEALDAEWMMLNGDYYGHFNSFLGMNVGALTWNDGTGPMFMDGNQFIMSLGRTMTPEIASRLFLLAHNVETMAMLPIEDGVLRLPPKQPAGKTGGLAGLLTKVPTFKHFLSGAWAPMELTGYGPNNTIMYAGIADLARQFNYDDVADAAIRGLDESGNFMGFDAERPFEAGLSTNTTAATARWSRLYKGDDFILARIPVYEGPILESAPYPEVIVTYANGRDGVLCLTLEPAGPAGDFPLSFSGLHAGTAYVVEGADARFTTDGDGMASVKVRLAARTTLLVRPEAM